MAREGKYSPDTEAVVSARGLEEFIKKLVGSVRQDEVTRGTWLRRQAHFLRRRYAKEWRGTDWPWPNAADIVPPTIDMTIDRLKPVFIRSTIGVRPVITLVARNPESFDKVTNLESFMDWLVETKLPNFKEEISYAVDNYLQHGFAVFKVSYDYRTRRIREVVDRDRLPRAIKTLVRPEISSDQANEAQLTTGIPFITQEEFAGAVNKDALRPLVQEHFGLDPKDPDDKMAEDALIKWLTSKKPVEFITIKRREVWRDTPRVTSILPDDLIVADYIEDIQNAQRITHRYYLSEQQIRERARDQKWSKTAVERLLAGPENRGSVSTSTEDTTLQQSREYIFTERPTQVYAGGMVEDQYELWDIYTFMDLDGDNILEKVIITMDPATQAVLRVIELPFKHGQWPFVQVRFEHNDKRFYRTRGIPEKLDDLDVEITNQHRAKLNQMTLVNSPVLLYRLGSRYNPENLRFIPGQHLPVTRSDDVSQLRLENKDLSFEREEQILQGYVERYIGVFDASLGEQGRLTRPRTATEINIAGDIQAQISGSRVLLWHAGMARVYNMIYDLWMQWGPEKVFVRVTGESPDNLVPMTRHEIQGDFDFVPTPSALNNPATAAQTAQAQLFTMTQLLPFAELIEPKFELNLGEALLAFLEAVDSRKAKRIVRRRAPQEIQQIQQAILQEQERKMNVTVPAAGTSVEDLAKRAQELSQRAESGEIPADVNVEVA